VDTVTVARRATLLTQSIFIQKGNSVFFDLSGVSGGVTSTTGLLNSTAAADLSASLKSLITATWPSSVSTVTRVSKSGSSYVEYRVAFATTVPQLSARAFPSATVDLTQLQPASGLYVMKLLGVNAYPRFFSGLDKTGFVQSGRYTCYKRELRYQPYSYYTGSLTWAS